MEKEVKDNIISILIDGAEISTKEQLFVSFKEALSFPDYFGMNWDALEDLLKDLSWLGDVESVRLTFINQKMILSSDDEKDIVIFKRIMTSAVEYWEKTEEGIKLSVEFKE